ncbi:MAG: hypothetical protein SFU20_03400 [Chitinophagaceae bacterium]|nr:hypothetical protein [Chitinophagaceae bacterium]
MKSTLLILLFPLFALSQEIDKDKYDEFNKIRTILTKTRLVDNSRNKFPFYVCGKSIDEKIIVYSFSVFFVPKETGTILSSTASVSFLFSDKSVLKFSNMQEDKVVEAGSSVFISCQLNEVFLKKVKTVAVTKIRIDTGEETQDYSFSDQTGIRDAIKALDEASKKPHPNQ